MISAQKDVKTVGKKSGRKRIMATGDWHCGSAFGLTPPSWHSTPPRSASASRKRRAKNRAALWNLWASEVTKRKPIDTLIVNGDLIDGRQEKSGSQELITVDCDEQVDMACELIRFVNAKNVIVEAGTPYHTGKRTDWERSIVKGLAGHDREPEQAVFDMQYIEVTGRKPVYIHAKHHIPGSQVPHGRMTAALREKLWNRLWANRDAGIPDAGIILRSHVHYYGYGGGRDFLTFTLPALQGMGGKFGSRMCSGTIDWGFVILDVEDGRVHFEGVLPPEADKIQKVRIVKV